MFGYINIYKSELKIKDYDIFRSYYCGLCKRLGKKYNQITRLGLSYDMTFLAILSDSLNDMEPEVKREGCIRHTGKKFVCKNNSFIDYSADMSIILTYYKLTDDISDNRSLKARVARIAYKRAIKKASLAYPEVAKAVSDGLEKLSVLEKEKCSKIDIVADPFATLTGEMFASIDLSLRDIGYNLGRFIYIADAYKDIEEDINNNSYNPYICAYDKEYILTDEFKKRVMGSLNMTLAAVSESYKKLKIMKNKAVLDNIIYLGLRAVYDNLFKINERNDNLNERSV